MFVEMGRLGAFSNDAAFVPPGGNVIANWAGIGTSGTSGLPTGWTAAVLSGVTITVLARTSYRGGNIIEYQFAGTAAASGSIYVSPGGLTGAAAAAAQVWSQRIYAEPVGAQSHATTCAIHWRNASALYLEQSTGVTMNGTIAGAPASPASATAPATTAYAAHVMAAIITSDQAVSIRMKVFAPILWRIS